MKKKGFTLIELLAVIVVLAIIALIATPIVMNVIKNAQKGATERSAERYVDAVETAITTDRLENGQIADGIYTVDADGNLVLGDKTLTVEVNGDKPAAGSKVAIENGQVVATGTTMTIGDYTVTINDKGSATAVAKGDVVALCTAAGSSVSYEPGTEYSCELGDGVTRTFYVLGEDGENIKLIMNENIGETVTWCASGNNNSCAADGAKAYLAGQTSGWTKLAQDKITLPTYGEIVLYEGLDWIKTNLDGIDSTNTYGYWTLSATTSSTGAYGVDFGGFVASYVTTYETLGIRPVISILKTDLSL